MKRSFLMLVLAVLVAAGFGVNVKDPNNSNRVIGVEMSGINMNARTGGFCWAFLSLPVPAPEVKTSGYLMVGSWGVDLVATTALTPWASGSVKGTCLASGGVVSTTYWDLHPKMGKLQPGLALVMPTSMSHQGKETTVGLRATVLGDLTLYACSQLDGSAPGIGASWTGKPLTVEAAIDRENFTVRFSRKVGDHAKPELRFVFPREGGDATVEVAVYLTR